MKFDYSRHYKKWHDNSPEHIKSMNDYYLGLLSPYLPKNHDVSVLDIGCGMGFTIMAFQDWGYSSIQGIDIDPAQIQSCLNKKLDVKLIDNTIDFLSQNKNRYDLITALDVLEHIPHDSQLEFIASCYNALKINGRLICTVPNANSSFAARWRYIDWTHHLSFTEHSLDFVLYNGGFNKILISETEFFLKPSLISLLKGQLIHWSIFRLCRTFRRIEAIGELGFEQGKYIPLSLNLIAVADK
jgi:2-polyprenyl-3-methyl-5-hydroxy-6-metoxy-1,4-benzoquinol methylase